jgi:DNA-binding NtrC family response regulator
MVHVPGAEALEPAPAAPAPGFRPLEEKIRCLERTRIVQALEATGGNQRRAAQRIGMPLRTFVSKLSQLGLRSPSRSPSRSP